MTSSSNRNLVRAVQSAYNKAIQTQVDAVNANIRAQVDAINTAQQAQADAVAQAAEDLQEQAWATITATMNNIRQIALTAPASIIEGAFSEAGRGLQTLPHVSVDTSSQTPEKRHVGGSVSGAPKITFTQAPRDLL